MRPGVFKSAALRRGGHGGNDEVDGAGAQRGDEAVEVNVAELHLASERLADFTPDCDVHAGDLARFIDELKRRIGGVGADDELVAACAGAEGE